VTYSGSLDAREEASGIEDAEPLTAEDSGEINSIDGEENPPGGRSSWRDRDRG
jgi:hypothetical protein